MAAPGAQSRWITGGLFIGVGVVAWLAAMGTGRVLRAQLALPDGAELGALEVGAVASAGGDEDDGDAAPTTRPRLRRKPTKKTYVDPIVQRSIFDSSKVGATGTTDVAVLDTGEEGRRSDLKVVLLATIVAEPAEFSSALIAEEKGGDGAIGYGIGDGLLGEATIVRIEPRKVVIRRDDGTIEYIAMEEGKTFEKGDGEKKAAKKDDGGGVSKDGDKFVVEQALIDQILENPEQLYSQIRAVPHKGPDGKVDGYRLSGIRRKSVFHKLGIKNGDIVHGVNGQSLTSMSAAMDAFNGLQNEKNFSFELTRRNNRKTQEYEIR
jgi:general secretion pathway protein C